MLVWLADILDILHSYLATCVEETNSFFAGNVVYLSMIIITITIIVKNKKVMNKGYKMLVASSIMILALAVYNPILTSIIQLLPNSNDMVVPRLWILFPIWIIIAYSLAVCVIENNSQLRKNAFVVMSACLVIAFGNTIIDLNMIDVPTNEYKINHESVEIVDEVLSLSGGKPTSIYMLVPSTGGPLENYVVGGSIYQGINQYTGIIDVHADSYTENDWNAYFAPDYMPDGITPTEDYLTYIFEFAFNDLKCDYVLFPDDDCVNQRLSKLKYTCVGHAGDYCIYTSSNI